MIAEENVVVKEYFRKKTKCGERGEGATGKRWAVADSAGVCGARLYPPLRDVQCVPPAAVCEVCGGEQYSFDEVRPVRGRLMCVSCAARMGKEEEMSGI